ncbi:glycosyltransferase [Microvirga terrae]|uniref:Glycosyltransferase n=1 Tax=Microvirga terrae TaxID=2740529 RepID=A0ABY5RMI2_9HYPH|nr:glycosyltransferase [Microvirga terrae]UVF18436.1 glycosyltransferase [Microvirga terrae]
MLLPDRMIGAMASTSKRIKVSVLVVAYNHERYIRQALESVMSQQTDFQFEVIVSEDASTDRTRHIIHSIAERWPDRIHVIESERNLRSNEAVARGLRAAQGKYVSLLDGDDYWISNSKLQTQASFLDENPHCTAIFHNALVARGGTIGPQRWTPSNQRDFSGLDDIWRGNPFATCAGMLRLAPIKDVPEWYTAFFPLTDWPLYILCAEKGKIAFQDENVGVYRMHDGGLFSSLPDSEKRRLISSFYRQMNKVLNFKYDHIVRDACSQYFYDWSVEFSSRGEISQAWECLWRCLMSNGVGGSVSYRQLLRLAKHLLAPRRLSST